MPKTAKNKTQPAEIKPVVRQTMDEIWGIRTSKYKQKDEASYKAFLSEMNNTDIRFHCAELNLPFYEDNRSFNIECLLKAFNKHQFEQKVYPTAQ